MSNCRAINSVKYKDYLTEAEDIIQHLNRDLYELKSLCQSSHVINPDIVNALFREIHTLKGISEVTGLPRLTALSHRLEDLLDCLRFGRIQLNFTVVDTLFEVVEILTELLNNVNEQGIEHTEIEPALNKIGNILDNTKSDDGGTVTAINDMPPDLSRTLSEFELHRLNATINEGHNVYRIFARLHIDTVDEEVEKLQAHLTGCGEIIAVIPVSGFSADGMVSFEFIYSSKDERFKTGLCGVIRGENTSIQNIGVHKNVVPGEQPRYSARSITKTVRVDIERLETLLNTVGEILLLNSTITHSLNDLKIQHGYNIPFLDINKSAKQLHKKLAFLRDGLIEIRLVPLDYLFSRLTRIVDMLSKELSKEIILEVSGGDTKLDKSMIEALADPLMHIIRNAIDHGIEDKDVRILRGKASTGRISVKATQKDSSVVIDIEDDGGGMDFTRIYEKALEMGLISAHERDEKRLQLLLFQPGFSTKSTIDDVSGRGVGLDVVAKNMADLSGMIEIETVRAKGTTFRITLPVTLLIVRALIVSESGREFAIPVNSISENLRLKEGDMIMIRDKESINLRGDCLPLIRLKDILKYTGKNEVIVQNNKYVIIAGLGVKKVGIIVDKIKGQREILIKPLGKFLKKIPCVIGFAEIDSKKVLPVIDVSRLI
ncbi:MAG: hypothetical protein A2132_00390 [Nitrospirae bacterium RBG_16_43_11]|nr:MAG: hypothetical protein A2132_00390 [Nitrospirae bacterium RBG_16_43_11]